MSTSRNYFVKNSYEASKLLWSGAIKQKPNQSLGGYYSKNRIFARTRYPILDQSFGINKSTTSKQVEDNTPIIPLKNASKEQIGSGDTPEEEAFNHPLKVRLSEREIYFFY